MEYTIRAYTDYNGQEILPLYRSVGWTNYTRDPGMLKEAYNHSLKIYGAYLEDQLIGVVRAVGDGYSVVFVQDLLVDPRYHRQGIGTALLGRILEDYRNVYQLHLLTDDTEKTVSFYKSLGFTMDTEMGCRAFSRYRMG